MTWQANWIAKQDGFRSANRILEIGAGGFQTTVFLARSYPDKEFYAIDFVLSPLALTTLNEVPTNLSIIKHDARDLGLFAENYFDLVFSVAVMEHIHELALHLKEAYRIICSGGLYWFWESPFWSSAKGHHYLHGSPTCPVPHYAHLHLERTEMAELLLAQGLSKTNVAEALARIYDREDLSRLTRTQTRKIIESSQFDIKTWEDDLDENYSSHGAEKVISNNLFSVSAADLQVKAAKVCLRKSD